MSGKEKRKFKRVPLRLKVDYRDVDDFFSSFATNLSEGGIFIKTKKPHPVGLEVKIKFLMPKTAKTINTNGIVVWSNSEDPRGDDYVGMGIEFQKLGEDDKRLIKEVVDNLGVGGKE